MTNKKILDGTYLVIDPCEDNEKIFTTLQIIPAGAIAAVQIWDNFKKGIEHYKMLILEIAKLCKQKQVPVIINNHWELVEALDLNGVHYDTKEVAEQSIYKLSEEVITGITCNNDLDIVKWAGENRLSYISFCSIFPSSTANSCELVKFETIQQARKIVDIPIFLAGGIKPENIHLLSTLEYSGIAVVSGIMSSSDPIDAINQYNNNTKKYL